MSLLAGGEYTGLAEVHGTTEYDAWPLIPQTESQAIASGITEASAALAQLTRLPDMSSRTHKMPVLGSLGNADFTGDKVTDNLTAGADQQIDDARIAALLGTPYGTGDPGSVPDEGFPGLKKTHQFAWENVFIVAEPIAIILPVPEAVLNDSNYDMWAAMRPRIVEAFGRRIDEAIIWGNQRPTSWPTGIVPTAINRGQVIAEGAGVDLAADFSELMGTLEEQAYDPTGFMCAPSIKADLRNLRDDNNNPIYTRSLDVKSPDTVWGLPTTYVKNNSFNTATARAICGAMGEAKYAIRSDISFKLFTEGVITDENGKVIINLMQQDSVAMRFVMRLGWAVPNPIHQLRPDRGGYPFSVLTA